MDQPSTPSTPRTPREVFLALVNGVAEGRWEELPSLYAEQTHVVHPFDPLRTPAARSRRRSGSTSGCARAPVGRQPTSGRSRAAGLAMPSFTRRPTPRSSWPSSSIRGPTRSGEAYALPAIFVMRVRDGEIVSSRDYLDAIASARIRGQLGELFAAVSGETGGAV